MSALSIVEQEVLEHCTITMEPRLMATSLNYDHFILNQKNLIRLDLVGHCLLDQRGSTEMHYINT